MKIRFDIIGATVVIIIGVSLFLALFYSMLTDNAIRIKDLQRVYNEEIRFEGVDRGDGHRCVVYYNIREGRILNVEHDVMNCGKCQGLYE